MSFYANYGNITALKKRLFMSEQLEVRKIPKKTIIIFGVLFTLGAIVFAISENTRVNKANSILNAQGYKNISNLKVYTKQKVENMDTKIGGFKYFVKFKNNDTNENCRGFILRNFKHEMATDISCKKGN